MNKKELLLSLASGCLVCLSFPKADLGFLIWIALVPLLFAIRNQSVTEAFRTGFLAGLVCYAGLMYWIVIVVVRYGHLPLYAGIAVMLLLVIYLSLYPAVFCAGVVYFRKRALGIVVSAPLLWTSLEYLKASFLSGFPWEDLAHSQYECLPVIQIADITGTFGISFLIVLVNCAVYESLNSLIPPSGTTRRFPCAAVAVTVGLFLVVFGYGLYRIDTLTTAENGLTPVPTAIVQGNIDQSIKWTPRYQQDTIDVYRQLSLDASGGNGSLIVWPETALPLYFQNDDDKTRDVINTAREAGAWLLFGSPSYERKEGAVSFYNSAYLVAPDGSVPGRYDKVHLVPFGEYVPLKRFLFFVDKLVAGAGDFSPGRAIAPLPMGDRKVGPLICYEGIFPEISRAHRTEGAELLVNITNDAWYGDSSAPYQHLTIAVFRTVENRIWMIRAANTGISAIVNATGEIVCRTGLFKRTVLNGHVRFTRHCTFYSRYGNIFACFCVGFLLIGFLISLRRRVL